MSNGQDKDEILAMAREAGGVQLFTPRELGAFHKKAPNIHISMMPEALERFATLCRAPLVAELEQAKKDAARYRWLVSQPNGGFFHPVFAVNNVLSWKSKAQYDAAIDASIAKEQS